MRRMCMLLLVVVGSAAPLRAQVPTSGPPEKASQKPILIVHPEARDPERPSQFIRLLSAVGVGRSAAADSPEALQDVQLEAILRVARNTKLEGVEDLSRLLAKGGVERIAITYEDAEGLGITLIADKQVRTGNITALLEDLRQFQKRHGENTTLSLKVRPESEGEGFNPFAAQDVAGLMPPRLHGVPSQRVLAPDLSKPISVHFNDASLGQFLDSIQKVAKVHLSLNEQGFKEVGVTTFTKVSVDVDEVPIESVLLQVLEPLKLGYVVQDGRLIITSERRSLQTVGSLKSRYEAEERAIADVVARIRGAKSATDAQRSELRARVAKAFALRQAQQQAELKEFQERMARVQKTIESREQSRERIIDRRVEELLNPAVQWDADVPKASVKPLSKPGEETPKASPVVSPLGALQGEWEPISFRFDNPGSRSNSEQSVLIEGNRWTSRLPGGERSFRFELNSSEHPNGFNRIGQNPDGTYVTHRGLYRLDGRILWTFLSEDDPAIRPKDFNDPQLKVSVYERKSVKTARTPDISPVLEGEWLLEKIEGNGIYGWESNLKVRVFDDHWVVLRGNVGVAYQMRIDTTADPMTLDLLREDAKSMRALVQFVDGKLHVFYSRDESIRPTGYDDPNATRHIYRMTEAGPIAMRVEQSRFEGRYCQVARIVDGKDVPPVEKPLEIRNMRADEAELRINPATRPRQFTAVHGDGQHAQRGIYEWLSGPGLPQDRLRFAQFTDEGRAQEFPKDFGPGPGVMITEWEREPETPVRSPDNAHDPAAAQPQSDSATRPVRLEFVGGEKKHPVPDVTVRLMRIDPKLGRVKGGIAEADDKGIARLSLAPSPSHYAASVESKQPLPYLPIPAGWKEHPWHADFYFKVEPGDSEQAFTLHLAAPCKLTLRAVDEATGKGLAGAVFATENALGEFWAQVINADTLGAPQLRESDFNDETVQTDSEGNFRRGLAPRPGWKYMVWRSPPGYEPVEPGKEVDVETPLGQATAEYTFKFRRIKAE